MSAWESWINAEDDLSLIVKCALGHYQFETLHPFSDGNGRIGRLVVLLQLVQEKALSFPLLNISPWFEDRKEQYKDHLLSVSLTGQYEDWIQFFCQAVVPQARDMIKRTDDLLTIRQSVLDLIRQNKARGVILDIAEDLVGYPYITPSEAGPRGDRPPMSMDTRRFGRTNHEGTGESPVEMVQAMLGEVRTPAHGFPCSNTCSNELEPAKIRVGPPAPCPA